MERTEIEGARVSEIQDGETTIVVYIQRHVRSDHRQHLKEIVQKAFPGRRVLIADGGMQVREVGIEEKLDRIEAKLDALLDALAEDEDDEPQFDLDGNLIENFERDDNESLD